MKQLLFLSTTVCFGLAFAQDLRVPAGASISVRTNQRIDVRNSSDSRIYDAVVDQEVRDTTGGIAIPRGSRAELIVRNIGPHDMALDLESIDVHGHRYAVDTNNITTGSHKEGVGENQRTAKYVGGGALFGTIVGAIAGGGKGAAIGAAAGAATGAGAQTATRGGAVRVPAESILTFRLERPLHVAPPDRGYERDGHHYHYNQ